MLPMQSVNRQEWMLRAFKNGRRWNLAAWKLYKAHMSRQAFVLATYANEEFTKSFLLWWSMATGNDVEDALSRHEVKQELAFSLATLWVWDEETDEEYLRDYSEQVAKLVTLNGKALRALGDGAWDTDRLRGVYEEKTRFRLDSGTVNLVIGVASTLQPKIGKLVKITPYGQVPTTGDLPRAFIDIFGLTEPFVARIKAILGSPTPQPPATANGR